MTGAVVPPIPEAPCDDCPHARGCAASGALCRAFDQFVQGGGELWRAMARVPSAALAARARARDIDQAARDELFFAALAAKRRKQRLPADPVAAGAMLLEQKLAVGHGHWLLFVREHYPVSSTTAATYIRTFKKSAGLPIRRRRASVARSITPA